MKNILLINDDGINAKGLWHLWNALKDHYNVTIIAPKSEQSGTGASITLGKPIHAERKSWDKATAWEVTGTPADCVRLGMTALLETKPDLIVSGINHGENSGRNVLYSGTIGGTIEGTYRGIESIAFSSLGTTTNMDLLEKYVSSIVNHFIEHTIPSGTLINVNFPNIEKFKGLRFAHQGMSLMLDEFKDSDGNYHHLKSRWMDFDEKNESDVHLLNEGFITAVPIKVSSLTDLKHFSDHRLKFDKLSDLHF